MPVTIHYDSSANAIFFSDANGVQFLNAIQASVGSPSTTVTITDIARSIEIVSDVAYSEFEDDNGASYGADATEVVNELNALFQRTGKVGQLPSVTSNLTANLVTGQTFNYELTATNLVAVEWDLSNVPGIATVEGNPRKLIGGSSLASGTYTIPVKAINYIGEDSRTLTLTVGTSVFANTKSISLSHGDYLAGTASNLSGVLGRASNGAGSGDAWSIAFWLKPSTATNSDQTVLYFGDTDVNNAHHLRIRYFGNDRKVRLFYGSWNDYLLLDTNNNTVPANTWTHILVTYDGGTTGNAAADINSYYGRFAIYIDGSAVSTTGQNANYGITTGMDADEFRVGRYDSANYLLTAAKVDELAIWASDQGANASTIYNGGTPHDLSALSPAPHHWWRMGDGDTFPTLTDSGTGTQTDLTMNNMNAGQIVSDVP